MQSWAKFLFSLGAITLISGAPLTQDPHVRQQEQNRIEKIISSKNKLEGNFALRLRDIQNNHRPVKKCIVVIEQRSESESITESVTCRTIKRKTRGQSDAVTLKGDNSEVGMERKMMEIRVQPQCLECVFTFLPGDPVQ